MTIHTEPRRTFVGSATIAPGDGSTGPVTLLASDAISHPARLAFHCLNNASQILRGDMLEEADISRARELIDEGTVHMSELYFEHIRVLRQLTELRATSAFLQRDPSVRALTLGEK